MTDPADDTSPAPDERSRWTPALRALFWVALVATLVLAVMPQPIRLPYDPSDKVQHFFAFLSLTVLGSAAYPRLSVAVLAIAMAVLGGAIEVVQAFPPFNRHADPMDWLVDVGGTLAAVFLVLVWRGLRRSR